MTSLAADLGRLCFVINPSNVMSTSRLLRLGLGVELAVGTSECSQGGSRTSSLSTEARGTGGVDGGCGGHDATSGISSLIASDLYSVLLSSSGGGSGRFDPLSETER